ncbi:cysteine desulfurase family protein [Kiritimatiella glycovorans]|uniref:cysteine desulfurase n=1 Tax=Kiritimatiella glycovorans TaxID=1307763 RepID=A0A0G3EA59_9BACT|nr:aminotransferase class V-fold PLP-dependent enzyme [Kiritimatiella glycovorans]AKJ63326.1 Cysteine desulfurase [Kiritimatiella glycovorans]
MPERNVYLDHNATTPLHPEVKRSMNEAMDLYGNPSSMHAAGREARARVEAVREDLAAFLNASADEVIFAGSGSEANNTVLNLFTCNTECPRKGLEGRDEILVASIEHPCVLETSKCLRARGLTVHEIPVDGTGKVDMDALGARISERTMLVSVMTANNEIGTIQDIRPIADLVHRHGAYLHTDAVQAVGKIPVDVRDLDADFLTLSAHKMYGPKGVGALYVKKGVPFCPFIRGGHQERGRRAGTENTLGIIGMGRAVELRRREMDAEAGRLRALRARLRAGIEAHIPDPRFNGHPEDRLPGTMNVSFPGTEGEALLLYLDFEGIMVSTGSACSSGSLDPSHVLLAAGLPAEAAHGSLRISLGRDTSEEDIDYVIEKLTAVVARVRAMSTVYN